MIYTHLAAVLVSASIAFPAGWRVNQWRNDSGQKQAIAQAALDKQELHRMEQKRSSGVIAAQNVSRTRETALRRDADASRDALDGLRTQSAAALLRARSGHDACIVTAATQAVIQSQCAAELQTLGGIADRHASDIETLTNAWPK